MSAEHAPAHHHARTQHSQRQTARVHGMPAKTMTVHLVRHGEGHHNVAGWQDPDNYRDPQYRDARLTERGRKQAMALQQRLATLRVEAAVVSSLTRAIETGLHALGERHDVPFVSTELCREFCDGCPCNERRSRTDLRADFPGVSFDELEDEHDGMYKHENQEHQLVRRIEHFVRWLHARPEREVVVFSHGTFLHRLLHVLKLPAVWFDNCDLRTLTIEYVA